MINNNKQPLEKQVSPFVGETSRAVPVTSGVPQGSILSPSLFLQYENHLSNSITNSKIAAFANALVLQNDLTKFEKSSTKINLALNPSKCKVLRVIANATKSI